MEDDSPALEGAPPNCGVEDPDIFTGEGGEQRNAAQTLGIMFGCFGSSQDCIHAVGDLLARLLEHVAVEVRGHGILAVDQRFHDGFRAEALGGQQRRAGVAQIVETQRVLYDGSDDSDGLAVSYW